MSEKKIIDETEVMALIQKEIKSVRYGSVTVIVQDGIVVQIEKNEKIRIHKLT